MNIAFVGPRRAGKSFISRIFAKNIDYPLLSTDSIASYELGGISIEKFIKNNDWKSFREMEFKILSKLQNCENIVLDCGGGFIFDIDDKGDEYLSDRKVEILKKTFKVIYINRNFEELTKEKNENLNNRPTLNRDKDYREILKNRIGHYETIADCIFFFDKNNVEKNLQKNKVFFKFAKK